MSPNYYPQPCLPIPVANSRLIQSKTDQLAPTCAKVKASI